MALIVQKFGGTSVGNSDRIKQVAKRVAQAKLEGNEVVVAVSAMGKSTNALVSLMAEISNNPSPREMDMLLATGEQVSIALLTQALHELGVPAISLTGWQAGIVTEPVHNNAPILRIDTGRVRELLDQGFVVVLAGFQGVTEAGAITTLGRGGSDTTAVAYAAALKADFCDIYTDVDGVYTADPRMVPEARMHGEISYDEMLELASLGAKVLHPRSVEYAKHVNLFLRVRSSFNEGTGTVVKGVDQLEKQNPVSGVAADLNQAKLAILAVPDQPGTAAMLFNALAEAHIDVDMIIQSVQGESTNDIAFTVAERDLSRAKAVVYEIAQKLGASGVISDADVAKVSIVGAGMINHPGTAATMFAALANAGINIQMISTSEIKVSCVIERSRAQEAVQVIHKAFALDHENVPVIS
ncbi:Aspartokinase [compost metagenome]